MKNHYLEHTKNWVREFVIGLNLCPFAKAAYSFDRIRYSLYETDDVQAFAESLLHELLFLLDEPEESVETTIMVHPNVLNDFHDYLDFLDWAQDILKESKLEGIIQIASFHPNYQFDGTEMTDVENYSNRSPYPMLHLLRESSVTKAVSRYEDAEAIPDQNMELLRKLGIENIQERLKKIEDL